MSVRVVAPDAWSAELDHFSRAHRGWLARVEKVPPSLDPVSYSGWCPLQRVRGTRGAHAPAIRIELTGVPSVDVDAPRALRVDTREDGAERALEIEAAGGEFVRLVFRVTALPEEVDGTAPAELIDG